MVLNLPPFLLVFPFYPPLTSSAPYPHAHFTTPSQILWVTLTQAGREKRGGDA